jgi:O-antigen/teichoic acid export membrane protein
LKTNTFPEIHKVIFRIKQNIFLKRMFLLLSGNIFGQGIALLAGPALTRLYSPSSFGDYAIYLSLVTVLGLTFSLRFDALASTEDSQIKSERLFSISILTCFFSFFIFFIILFVFLDLLKYSILNTSKMILYFCLVSSLLGSLIQVIQYKMLRAKELRKVAIVYAFQFSLQVFLQIILSKIGTYPTGLIFGDLIAKLIIILGHFRYFKIKKTSSYEIFATFTEYKFHIFSNSSQIFLYNVSASVIPNYAIRYFFGTENFGYFSICQRYMWGPLNILAGATSKLFYTNKDADNKVETIKEFSIKNMSKIFLIAVISFSFFMFSQSSEWFFINFFGKQWSSAATLLKIIAPLFIIQYIFVSFQPLYEIKKQYWAQLVSEVSRVIVLVILFFEFKKHISFFEGMEIYSLQFGIYYIFSLLVLSYSLFSRKRLKL